MEVYPSSEYEYLVSRHTTAGKAMTILLILALFVVVVIASVVHVWGWGNKKDAKVETFKSSQQYEEAVLRRKETWAQWLTVFSFPRMFN